MIRSRDLLLDSRPACLPTPPLTAPGWCPLNLYSVWISLYEGGFGDAEYESRLSGLDRQLAAAQPTSREEAEAALIS